MGNKQGRKPRVSVKLMRKRLGQLVHNHNKRSDAQPPAAHSENDSTQGCSSVNEINVPSPSTHFDDQNEDIHFVESHDNMTTTGIVDNSAGESKYGRRVVNVNQFFTQLQEISSHGPLNCGLQSVEIVSETRTGLISQLALKCKMCKVRFLVHNDNAADALDLNTSAVAGTVATGCGYTQLSDLLAAIGIPPMSKAIFSSKLSVVHKKWEEELLKSMTEAAEEERSLAIAEGRVNSDGIAIIDVIADGCYSKRSYKKNYSALSGAAAIIGKRTNKILYLAIKNKYCSICAVAQSKDVEAKEHTCFKNYSGFLYRDGRAFAMGKAYSNGLGGQASGEASVGDSGAQAYGSALSDQLARADLVYPGQAQAQAEVYEAPAMLGYGSAKAVAEAQNGGATFYVPAPATVVSYEQNFAPSEISYQVPAAQSAQSTASINGAGSATSSARTQGIGSYKTTSNANIQGSGFGSASSNANYGVGSANTAVRTQGMNSGYSSADSQADGGLSKRATADVQSDGGYGSASSSSNNVQGSAISSAKTHGYSSSAASDASVNSEYDSAISSAKVAPVPQKTISWRFGTLYGTPSHINTRAQANANGFGAAKSTADVHQTGSAHSAADTYGSAGAAKANANVNGGYGSVNSEANTHGSGFAKSAANTQGSGYGSAQSQANGAGFGAAKSSANTGYGTANANADVNGGAGFAKSAANNGAGYGGSARSDANVHGFGSAHANARVH